MSIQKIIFAALVIFTAHTAFAQDNNNNPENSIIEITNTVSINIEVTMEDEINSDYKKADKVINGVDRAHSKKNSKKRQNLLMKTSSKGFLC